MNSYYQTAALLGLLGANAGAATLYVSTTGSGDCSSWVTACGLSQALSTAVSGDQVWVKSGTYTGSVSLVNGVQMIGGFAGTETAASQSNPIANVTILDAANSDRAVYSQSNAASTVLRGFTLQNGWDDGLLGGGALLVDNSSAVFVRCTFQNNSAGYFGGAVSVRGASTPHFANCLFKDNGTGSGTSVQPLGGGVVYLYEGTATFTNCLFHDNKAGEGGALLSPTNGLAKFYNCTLANNQSTIGDGGAIFVEEGQMIMRNSILWGNQVPSGKRGPQVYHGDGYPPSVEYCDVQGGWSGTGNINANPAFLNASAGDFRIGEKTSPCKDVGNNPDLPTDAGDLDWDNNTGETVPKDLNMNNRKIQITVDMGACEAPFYTGGGGEN